MKRPKLKLNSKIFFWAALVSLFFNTACQPRIQNPLTQRLHEVKRWLILYDKKLKNWNGQPFEWKDYDMAILNADGHPELDKIPDRIILIAYVSFGSAEDHRSYWPMVKDQPWVLAHEKRQGESYFVDVRHKAWRELLIGRVIPDIVAQGFDGVFMDTLDYPIYLEKNFPEKYAGSERALVDLVREVREAFPDLTLISNNGYEILPEIALYINAALAESIHGRINAGKDGFEPVPEKRKNFKVTVLKRVVRKFRLPVFNVDFAPPEDRAFVRECIQSSRQLGFKPYVAGLRFDRIYPQE